MMKLRKCENNKTNETIAEYLSYGDFACLFSPKRTVTNEKPIFVKHCVLDYAKLHLNETSYKTSGSKFEN